MKRNWIPLVVLLFGVMAVGAWGADDAAADDATPSDAVVLGEEDLADRAEILRNMYRRITPPDIPLVQDVGTWPAAWEEFGAEWNSAASDREYGAWVVPVVLSQVDGVTAVSDAAGALLWQGTTDFARSESASVVLTGGLVAEEDWDAYEAVRDAVAGLSTENETAEADAGFALRSAPPTNGLRFTSIITVTNGAVVLGIAHDEDVPVDVFAYAVAHTSSWVVATWTNDENVAITSTNLVWNPSGASFSGLESAWEWRDTVAVSNGVAEFADANFTNSEGRVRFYALSTAQDTDDDGLNDGVEWLVSHTSPGDWDSDNDGLSDAEEIPLGTNPNSDDTDGDGLPDGWEVLYGLDPLDDGSEDSGNGPDGDPDRDGFPNSLEYTLAGRPHDPAWSGQQVAYRLCHLQNGEDEPGLRVEVENALNCGTGSNDGVQNVAATLDVPDLLAWGYFLDVTVEGSVEDQRSGYDVVTIEACTNTYYFEGNNNFNGCQMATKCATRRVLVLPRNGVSLRYNTVGHKYHTDAYAEIKGAEYIGEIQSRTDSEFPYNRERTTLGVGEGVHLSISPDAGEAVWRRAGQADPIGLGSEASFTADSQPGSDLITVSFGNVSVSKWFDILAPSGVVSAPVRSVKHHPVGMPGAGMHLCPVTMGPTSVSFCNVRIKEIGRDASNCSGYWTNHPAPSHIDHGAGEWIDLDERNRWPDAWDRPRLFRNSVWQNPPDEAGHCEWEIPVVWQVRGTDVENSMPGWRQEFDLEADGTMTVQKFGKWVTRTIGDVSTHN